MFLKIAPVFPTLSELLQARICLYFIHLWAPSTSVPGTRESLQYFVMNANTANLHPEIPCMQL